MISANNCWPASQCPLPHQQDWEQHLHSHVPDCCPQNSVVIQVAQILGLKAHLTPLQLWGWWTFSVKVCSICGSNCNDKKHQESIEGNCIAPENIANKRLWFFFKLWGYLPFFSTVDHLKMIPSSVLQLYCETSFFRECFQLGPTSMGAQKPESCS